MVPIGIVGTIFERFVILSRGRPLGQGSSALSVGADVSLRLNMTESLLGGVCRDF
jgi:hypothetical protein